MYSKEEKIKVYVMIGTIIMLLVIFSGIIYAFLLRQIIKEVRL